jgi:hypothetical protein
MSGDLTPLYNNREHIDALKQIVYRQLDRAYHLEREQAKPEIKLEGELEPVLGLADRDIPFHEAPQLKGDS